MDGWRRDWFPPTLLGAFLLIWIAFGVDPLDRMDWVLENLLVFVALPVLVLSSSRYPLTRFSYGLLFIFFALHAVGSHWSYSNVPIDWEGMGYERNHYDRVVHLAFGLLLWLPTREVLEQAIQIGRRAASVFAVSLLMTGSATYEVLEWGAVQIVAPELGNAFLGAQGDEFDAPKDMALAGLGNGLAIVSAAIASAINGLRTRTRPGKLSAARIAPPGDRSPPSRPRRPG